MELDLADRLTQMAEAEERAIGSLFRWALANEGAAAELAAHMGWHPTLDPRATWADADADADTAPAPAPAWLVDWPDAPPAARRLRELIAAHVDALRAIVDEHGWPGRALVGEDGSDAAWFLAMHADADPGLQRQCVGLLRPAVATGDADPRHLATLSDRVTSAARGDQLYGTLALLHDAEPAFLVPVRGPSALTSRRAAIGLPPVADDLDEDGGRGQLPYRHLRQTPFFSWPPAVAPY